MATKQQLIEGIETLIQESRRLSTALTDEQWLTVVDLDGWKNREVLAHISGIGGMVVPMLGGILAAPAGTDAFAGINIDQINAGIVGARADKTAAELAEEAATVYKGVIDYLRGADDETLVRRVTVLGYKDVEAGDILMRMVILHGLAHIYSVYSGIFNANS